MTMALVALVGVTSAPAMAEDAIGIASSGIFTSLRDQIDPVIAVVSTLPLVVATVAVIVRQLRGNAVRNR